jgi:hypothetical protein
MLGNLTAFHPGQAEQEVTANAAIPGFVLA